MVLELEVEELLLEDDDVVVVEDVVVAVEGLADVVLVEEVGVTGVVEVVVAGEDEVVMVVGETDVVDVVVVCEEVAVVAGGISAETIIPKVVKLLFSFDSSTVPSPSTFNSIKL